MKIRLTPALPVLPMFAALLMFREGEVLAQSDPLPSSPPSAVLTASPSNPSPRQSPLPGDAPPSSVQPNEKRGPMGGLSDAEKAQVKAAHDKAIQQDPKLEQRIKEAKLAMEAAKKAMHDAMVKADPSVEPILAKMMPPPKPPGNQPGQPGASSSPVPSAGIPVLPPGFQPAHHLPPPGLANLSEQERQKLMALHDRVRADPSVAAAGEAVRTALTPEARRAAEEALHQARKEAMLKADPSVAPILEKLRPEETRDAGNPGPSVAPSPAP